jgi:hypothetical protein
LFTFSELRFCISQCTQMDSLEGTNKQTIVILAILSPLLGFHLGLTPRTVEKLYLGLSHTISVVFNHSFSLSVSCSESWFSGPCLFQILHQKANKSENQDTLHFEVKNHNMMFQKWKVPWSPPQRQRCTVKIRCFKSFGLMLVCLYTFHRQWWEIWNKALVDNCKVCKTPSINTIPPNFRRGCWVDGSWFLTVEGCQMCSNHNRSNFWF